MISIRILSNKGRSTTSSASIICHCIFVTSLVTLKEVGHVLFVNLEK